MLSLPLPRFNLTVNSLSTLCLLFPSSKHSSRDCDSSPVSCIIPGNSLCSWPHPQTRLEKPSPPPLFLLLPLPTSTLPTAPPLERPRRCKRRPADTRFSLVFYYPSVVRALASLPCICLWLCAWVFVASSSSQPQCPITTRPIVYVFPFALLTLTLSFLSYSFSLLFIILLNYSHLTDPNQSGS